MKGNIEMRYLIKTFLTIMALAAITACEGDNMTNSQQINLTNFKVDNEVVDQLSNARIFFGHQSVGGNVIEGMEKLLNDEQKAKLRIVKSADPESLSDPGLAHLYIGENGDPILKLKEFSKAINGFSNNKPDIALFKFCYLDIDKNTDVDEVFNAYKNTIDKLKADNPDTKFVHMTVPLTVKDSFLRGFVKKIIGRPDNNINRTIFNEMIYKEYSGSEPVFDLAGIESTKMDGSRVELKSGSKKYYALADEYAADSGHLNDLGQLNAAKKLINFLKEVK